MALTPHPNFLGEYSIGSLITLHRGYSTATCPQSFMDCPIVTWPGGNITADGLLTGGASYTTWFGNLLSQKTDGSGLHFMRNRYYDPQTGRFSQQDPAAFGGGLNLYGFASGDPVNFSDPFGLCAAADGDSILVTVHVCANGREEERQVWAHKVPASELPALTNAADRLGGGNGTFTPSEAQWGYGAIVRSGEVYTFAPTTPAGETILEGAVTSTGGRNYVAFSTAVWPNVVSGNLGQLIGSRRLSVCQIVGHEGVHLLQGAGMGVNRNRRATKAMRENEALSVSWSCL